MLIFLLVLKMIFEVTAFSTALSESPENSSNLKHLLNISQHNGNQSQENGQQILPNWRNISEEYLLDSSIEQEQLKNIIQTHFQLQKLGQERKLRIGLNIGDIITQYIDTKNDALMKVQQDLEKNIKNLSRDVTQYLSELTEEKKKTEDLSRYVETLNIKIKLLEDKMSQDTCPESCSKDFQLQLTTLNQTFKEDLHHLSDDVSSVKQKLAFVNEQFETVENEISHVKENQSQAAHLIDSLSTSLNTTSNTYADNSKTILDIQQNQASFEKLLLSCAKRDFVEAYIKSNGNQVEALETRIKILEEDISQETCPGCFEDLQLQITNLNNGYKEKFLHINQDILSVQEELACTKEEMQNEVSRIWKNQSYTADLVKETSTLLATTEKNCAANTQTILDIQNKQTSLAQVIQSYAAKNFVETYVKTNVNEKYEQLKHEIQGTINRFARIVASKDALQISSGLKCPNYIGYNTKAPCKRLVNNCYCIVTSHELNWGNADKYCRWYGMTLASMETKQEEDTLVGWAKSLGFNNFWIGGTNRFHDKTWIWAGTEAVLGPYTNWAQGEPNNGLFPLCSGGNGKYCMQFSLKVNISSWNDMCCARRLKFICKAPLP